MKILGIIVLSVGVAIAASAGARLTPKLEEQVTLGGAAQFRSADTQKAFEAYCEARKEAGLDPADGCPDEAAQEPAAAPDPDDGEGGEEPAPPTFEDLVAAERAKLEALRASEEDLTGDVLAKREAWLGAFETGIEPSAAAAVAETPGPGARLGAWASESGPLFGVGLVLIVAGAFVGRVAVKREATREQPESGGKDAGPKDFGAVLDELEAGVRRIAEEARALESPKREDYERVKAEIEAVQLDGFEPLVAARQRVQVKYGMAGFAEIFGPLSSAERKVNRAWSALVDQHWPETQDSLEAAAGELAETHRVLQSLVESSLMKKR